MTGAATADAPALRDYQRDAIARFDDARAAGRRRIVLVAPTGCGKTVIAASIIQREAIAGRRVLFIAPRRELVHQAGEKLEAFGVDHAFILAGDARHNTYAPIQVASIDTLRARHHKLQALDPHVVVIDECHVCVTRIRTRLLARWPNALLIGLTATPARKDGRGLRVLFDTLIEVSTPAELTKHGHLVPARYFSVSEPDMPRVASIAGDYKVGEAERAMAPLIADVVQTWLVRAGGRRTVVFCMSVAHSVSLRALFAAAGVKAEHVDGSTPLELRAAILERFARGDTEVLCNVMVASIGFDVPPVDCIVLARPTKSLVMYLQMIGRGLRPAPGKRDCLILDHSGTVHRLGFAADERCWTLDGHADLSQARAAREGASGKSCTCPECACVFVGSRVCPECGHYIAPKGREIMTLEGDLVEIGPALTAEDADKLAFFLELRGFAAKRGFKPGFAAYAYKEQHGAFPPWNWNAAPAAEPTLATSRWLTARYRARLKAASV